jgi:NADPH:quinone reductase
MNILKPKQRENMKAIRVHQIGDASVLQYEETATPEPDQNEVLIRVKAAGINPVDAMYRDGRIPTALPFTPGSDCAGTVEKVGSDVHHLKVGDRVFAGSVIQRSYAEFMLCHSSFVYPLPENLSFIQGAALYIPYFTAYRALVRHGNLQKGETVVIHGATGGVGIAAVQIAKALGANIIATGGTDYGRDLLKNIGATHVIDHRNPDHYDKIMKLTNMKGTDVLLEIASGFFRADMDIMAPFGRIVSIVGGTFELPVHELMHKDISITGMDVFNTPDDEKKEIAAWLTGQLTQGSFSPIIREVFPLHEAARAHEFLAKPGAAGKLILIP